MENKRDRALLREEIDHVGIVGNGMRALNLFSDFRENSRIVTNGFCYWLSRRSARNCSIG